MCLAQGPQPSDAGEARTRGPSVSSQALYHWATALPVMLVDVGWCCLFVICSAVGKSEDVFGRLLELTISLLAATFVIYNTCKQFWSLLTLIQIRTNKMSVLIWIKTALTFGPNVIKLVHSQTQNKVQWLVACAHVSASSQSLHFILSLRMNSSFITSGLDLW